MATMVAHPAALVHVAPGTRTPRVSFVACRTPVDLVEADPRDLAPFDPACVGFRSPPGDRLPQRIAGTGPIPWIEYRDMAGTPVTPGRLAALLASTEDGGPVNPLPPGTPLRAWGHPDSTNVPSYHSWTSRGGDLPDDRIGRVERDGREAAAAAARRWLAERYRIVGDAVMVRISLAAEGSAGGVFTSDLHTGMSAARVRHPAHVVAGGADYPAALAYANEAGRVRARGDDAALKWAEFVGDADAGFGAAVAADGLPMHLRRIIRRCAGKRRAWGDAAFADELKAAGEALVALEVDGITGLHACGIRPDVAGALRTVRDAARLVASRPGGAFGQEGRNYDVDVNHAHAMAHAIEGFYLPSVPAPAPPREDVDALARLGP